jgi:hypothetical protein
MADVVRKALAGYLVAQSRAENRGVAKSIRPEIRIERSLLSGDIQQAVGKEIQPKRAEPTKAEIIARIERLEREVAKEKM